MVKFESSNPEIIIDLVRNTLTTLVDNIDPHFQNVQLVTLSSLLDPRNCQSAAKPDSIVELGRYFDMDGPKHMNEFKS